MVTICSIPKIQEIILQALGLQELGKNLNGDEAAALGLAKSIVDVTHRCRRGIPCGCHNNGLQGAAICHQGRHALPD